MHVAVVGLGYVGTVGAVSLARHGHQVTAIDISEERVASLRSGQTGIYEPGLQEILDQPDIARRIETLHTREVETLEADVFLVCVGTPATPGGGANLSFVREAVAWVTAAAAHPSVIVVKSTVPPGTGNALVDEFVRHTPPRLRVQS